MLPRLGLAAALIRQRGVGLAVHLRAHRRHARGDALAQDQLGGLARDGGDDPLDVLAVLLRELLVELTQALANVPHAFDGRTVIPIDLGGGEVDVQDALVPAGVPA